MALHVKTNLQTSLVNKATNPDYFYSEDAEDGDAGMTLPAMQKLVGGFIQVVNLRKPLVVEGISYVHLVCNEEGKLSGLAFNAIATRLAKLDNSISVGDVIVGDVLLLERGEIN
ncbi:hypothetical protein CNR34_00116 [Pseudomonas phage nickie]|uniref:DUF3846 domain-containing protein n=1 Tax=Pseudomonas phage nickie TaxID=2048977 RepID=A0A2H4P7A4_9CAUD|nr:hypothetical protein FDJ16_gp049 [Pseudomonas phage nickie]ATW58049.1 hypothetical protein CNR34_00116 [Pseudomonas phage nickie]